MKDWSMKFALTILSIIFTDSYFLYKGARGNENKLTSIEFFENLSAELIDCNEKD